MQPCCRRREAVAARCSRSGSASRAATSCVTWSSCVKCRVWRRRVGLAVLVGRAVRLRSVGDGIGSAFFLLRARWLNSVAPNFCTGGFPSKEHTATRKLASAQPVWSRRCAPPSLRSGPSRVTRPPATAQKAITAVLHGSGRPAFSR